MQVTLSAVTPQHRSAANSYVWALYRTTIFVCSTLYCERATGVPWELGAQWLKNSFRLSSSVFRAGMGKPQPRGNFWLLGTHNSASREPPVYNELLAHQKVLESVLAHRHSLKPPLLTISPEQMNIQKHFFSRGTLECTFVNVPSPKVCLQMILIAWRMVTNTE